MLWFILRRLQYMSLPRVKLCVVGWLLYNELERIILLSVRGLTKALSRHPTGGTEEIHKEPPLR
jgi:hypothetical protein